MSLFSAEIPHPFCHEGGQPFKRLGIDKQGAVFRLEAAVEASISGLSLAPLRA